MTFMHFFSLLVLTFMNNSKGLWERDWSDPASIIKLLSTSAQSFSRLKSALNKE